MFSTHAALEAFNRTLPPLHQQPSRHLLHFGPRRIVPSPPAKTAIFSSTESDDESESSGSEFVVTGTARKFTPMRAAAREASKRIVCINDDAPSDIWCEDNDERLPLAKKKKRTLHVPVAAVVVVPPPPPLPVPAKKQKKAPVKKAKKTTAVEEQKVPTSKTNTCVVCEKTGVVVNQCALLHHLFKMGDLFRRVWSIWIRYFKNSTSDARQEDSVPMSRLRGVLQFNGIAWNARCSAFRDPFDHGNRDGKSSDKPYSFREAATTNTAPWIDSNIKETLKHATARMLGAPMVNADVLDFYDIVVSKSIVYLHEMHVRRARGDNACTLASLEREYRRAESIDGLYRYIVATDIRNAAANCAELAARQQMPANWMRPTHTVDLCVRGQMNGLHRADLPLDEFERRQCAIVRHTPGGASSRDYLWPLELGVHTPMRMTWQMQKMSMVPVPTLVPYSRPPTPAQSEDESESVKIFFASDPEPLEFERSLISSNDTWQVPNEFFDSMTLPAESKSKMCQIFDDDDDFARRFDSVGAHMLFRATPPRPKEAVLSPRRIDHTSGSISDFFGENRELY